MFLESWKEIRKLITINDFILHNCLSFTFNFRLEHNVVKGKSGVIDIQTGGGEPGVVRDKSGHLVVVSININYIILYYLCIHIKFS